MLDMSICRGDLPSAKLALRAISLFSKDPVGSLISTLTKTSLTHFSVIPEEILRLDMGNAWMIISGMCVADLDKRAHSIASLYLRGRSNPITHNFMRWKMAAEPYKITPYINTYMDKLVYEVVISMNRRLPDSEYFQFSGISFGDVEIISDIKPEYYLGAKSWLRDIVCRYIQIITKSSANDVEAILNILEQSYTTKIIQYDQDYWAVLKEDLFKNSDMENVWKTSLRKKVLSLVTEILEIRVPILMHG